VPKQRRFTLIDYSGKEDLLFLIDKAQKGDQDAFGLLKDRYKPLIESCSYRYTSADMPTQDAEDLRGEALVHFCNAVCSYDVNSNSVEFGLYAKICITNGLVSYMRSYARRQRNRTVSLDSDKGGEVTEYAADILQELVDEERAAELVRAIKKNLSDYENRIWWLYVSGMSVADISKAIASDTKSVSNAVYRIRKKLGNLIRHP
jgi:RNA polymerase sigma factor (sigma-70 family)